MASYGLDKYKPKPSPTQAKTPKPPEGAAPAAQAGQAPAGGSATFAQLSRDGQARPAPPSASIAAPPAPGGVGGMFGNLGAPAPSAGYQHPDQQPRSGGKEAFAGPGSGFDGEYKAEPYEYAKNIPGVMMNGKLIEQLQRRRIPAGQGASWQPGDMSQYQNQYGGEFGTGRGPLGSLDKDNARLPGASGGGQGSTGSLWQSIMGYHPNTPQNYGWEEGWEKYGDSAQSAQQVSASNNLALNPAMAQLMPQSPGVAGFGANALANSQAGVEEAPAGDAPAGGGSGGPSGTPTTTTPGDVPRTPYNPSQPTGSGWDEPVKNYATGFKPYQGGGNKGLNDALIAQLMKYMSKPNSYDSDLLVGSYNRLEGQLKESGGIDRQRIKEEMASRGLGDSTIYGGRLGDQAIQEERSRADLAHQLLEDAARMESESQSNALSLGLGYDQFQQGMDYNIWQGNNAEEGNRLGFGTNYDNQEFMKWLQKYMTDHEIDMDEFDMWMQQMGL